MREQKTCVAGADWRPSSPSDGSIAGLTLGMYITEPSETDEKITPELAFWYFNGDTGVEYRVKPDGTYELIGDLTYEDTKNILHHAAPLIAKGSR